MKPYTDHPHKLCQARNRYRLVVANTLPAKKAARRQARKSTGEYVETEAAQLEKQGYEIY